MYGRQDRRTFSDVCVDCIAKAHVDKFVRADVAVGRESGFEGPLCVHLGVVSLFRWKAEHVFVEAFVLILLQFAGQVNVGIDEACQDGCVAQVDYFGARWDGSVANRHDLVAGDSRNPGPAVFI